MAKTDRIKALMVGNFAAKIIATLGVLCKPNQSQEFFTVSDIIDHMIKTSGHTGWTWEEVQELQGDVTSRLSYMRKNKKNGIYDTDKKTIMPRHASVAWPRCQASRGYRLGRPIQTPVVTRGVIEETKTIIEHVPTVSKDIEHISTQKIITEILGLIGELENRLNQSAAENFKLNKRIQQIDAAIKGTGL